MKGYRYVHVLVLAGLFFSWMIRPAYAQGETGGRDTVFEQEILDRLAVANPEAVPVFQDATRALDADDFETARQGFSRVLDLAPDFPDALRRLSTCELSLGQTEAALSHAQRAVDLDPTPYNKSVLAHAYVIEGSPASATLAFNLAKEAVDQIPEDGYANTVLMFAAAVRGEKETLRTTCETLIRMAPDYGLAHFYYGLVAAQDGKWEKAEAELLKAQELGMPEADIQQALAATGIAANAKLYRSLRWGGYGVAAWLGGMALLFLLGGLLSWITLAAVKQALANPQKEPSSFEKLVRGIYRAIIGLTSIYFYISIPFVILVVLGGAAGIIYLFFAVGHVPIRLVFIIGVTALYTFYAVLRSIFTRIKEQEPGRPLSQSEAPALWRATNEVANKLGTRPIQAIYITPGTEIGVIEQGGFWKKLRGKGKRCLILGLGVLTDMKQGQFKSILAHEYGHFRGKDTAGGDLARQVQISLQQMAFNLSASGLANIFNPAWWFVNGFFRVFLRVTHGASRLQEILADRYAAIAYGARNFVDGLSHVIRQGVTFNLQVNYEVNQTLQAGGRLHNLYTLSPPQEGDLQKKLSTAIDEALNRQSTPYDTHPAPQERFHLVQALNIPERLTSLDDDYPAWDLLPNAATLQQEMTVLVQENIDKRAGK